MLVGAIVSVLIFIVMGITLITPIWDAMIATVVAVPTIPMPLAWLMGALLYVFVVIIILGAMAWLTGG